MKLITNIRKSRIANAVVSKFPVLTGILLEGSSIGQIIRMWTERTAAGQSLWSWCMVNLAIWLWLVFFVVKTPNEKWAIWSEAAGVVTSLGCIFSVIYFRYVV